MANVGPLVPVHRPDPAIWVRRLVIYERCEPALPIREITLRRGLNIIQGAGIGHAVGKSTLCRLLRYCLGEAPEAGRWRAELAICLPTGRVGADVVVDGQSWAVLRSIGLPAADLASDVHGLDEISADPGLAKGWDALQVALAAASIGRLSAPLHVDGGESATWRHILAACTRDQDTRLIDILTWRARQMRPRRTGDRSAIYRSLLGLLHIEEMQARQEMDRLELAVANATSALTRRHDEARIRFLDHWRELARDPDMGARNPFTSWASGDLGIHIIDVAAARLRSGDDNELTMLDGQLRSSSGSLAAARQAVHELRSRRKEVDEAIDLNGRANRGDLNARAEVAAMIQRRLDDGSLCKHMHALARVRFGLQHCKHLTGTLDHLRSSEHWDAVKNEEIGAVTAILAAQRSEIVADLENAELQAAQAETTQGVLNAKWREVARRLDRLTDAHARVTDAMRVNTGEDPATADEKREIERLTVEKEQARQKAISHLEAAKDEIDNVKQLFHRLVQAVAGPRYKAQAKLDRGTIDLRIANANTQGGVTYHTLGIILADLTAMLRGIAGYGIHPGLLIHDCPREADMSADLYAELFKVAAGLELMPHSGTEAAFQYIITTTTAPPEELDRAPWVRERLATDPTSQLLFRRNISTEQAWIDPETESDADEEDADGQQKR